MTDQAAANQGGMARFVRFLRHDEGFQPGSALYHVRPSLMVYVNEHGLPQSTAFVIVAQVRFHPRYGTAAATIFAAQKSGQIYHEWPLSDPRTELLAAENRQVGRTDHALVLARLGYMIEPPETPIRRGRPAGWLDRREEA